MPPEVIRGPAAGNYDKVVVFCLELAESHFYLLIGNIAIFAFYFPDSVRGCHHNIDACLLQPVIRIPRLEVLVILFEQYHCLFHSAPPCLDIFIRSPSLMAFRALMSM